MKSDSQCCRETFRMLLEREGRCTLPELMVELLHEYPHLKPLWGSKRLVRLVSRAIGSVCEEPDPSGRFSTGACDGMPPITLHKYAVATLGEQGKISFVKSAVADLSDVKGHLDYVTWERINR